MNPRVIVDGIGLAYEENGAGPAVVFVHGLPASSYSWRRVAQELSRSYRTICFDLMGFGRSDKPPHEHYTIERQSELLLGAMRQMALEQPVLIGHSLGGGVCLSLMRNLGESQQELRGLVLVDSVCYPQPMPWFMSLLRVPALPRLGMKVLPETWGFRLAGRTMYHPRNRMSPDAISEYARNLASPGAQNALISTIKSIVPTDLKDFTESYSNISVPTQVIWGAQDKVIPLALGRRLAQEIPKAKMHEIDVCGHCPQEECPEETADALLQFVRSLDSGNCR